MDQMVMNGAPQGGERERSPSAIAVQVRQKMNAEGMTARQVSDQSGVARSTLAAWLNGTYQGVVEGVDAQMEKWLNTSQMRERMRRTLPVELGFLPTPSATVFFSTFEYAQASPDIGVITGGAGVGKTMAAEKYCADTPNAWLLTVTPEDRAPTKLLAAIAGVLDCAEGRGRRMDAIVRRVRGTGGLLIVDEAQHLVTESFEQLRSIHDIGKIGVVWMGNDPLKGRIEGMGRAASHAQIFSRVGKRTSRSKPQYADIMMILDAHGIEDKSLRGQCRWIAMQPGGLRQMIKVLRVARTLAGQEALGEAHLDDAWRDLTQERALPKFAGRE